MIDVKRYETGPRSKIWKKIKKINELDYLWAYFVATLYWNMLHQKKKKKEKIPNTFYSALHMMPLQTEMSDVSIKLSACVHYPLS